MAHPSTHVTPPAAAVHVSSNDATRQARLAPGSRPPSMTAANGNTSSLVVLPTYNERENLEPIVAAILAQAPDLEVLVVDDDSPDGTGAIADRLSAESAGRVHVLH